MCDNIFCLPFRESGQEEAGTLQLLRAVLPRAVTRRLASALTAPDRHAFAVPRFQITVSLLDNVSFVVRALWGEPG